jgi:GTPase SAR1 family protein
MEVTMVGLQNAGKTSLLRVLAVGSILPQSDRSALTQCFSQGGEFTLE